MLSLLTYVVEDTEKKNRLLLQECAFAPPGPHTLLMTLNVLQTQCIFVTLPLLA